MLIVILQSMMHSIEQLIKGGQKVFSQTVTGKIPESKIGLVLVMRGYSKKRISQCKKILQNLVQKIEKH